MEGFRQAGTERVNVFQIDDIYLFKHYFEGEDVFAKLKPYYHYEQYRFEVPPDAYDNLQKFLSEHGYGLIVVEEVGEFVVVVKKYTGHPDNIFKGSVMQRSSGEYNCFLMKDTDAVEAAIDDGGTHHPDTNLESPF